MSAKPNNYIGEWFGRRLYPANKIRKSDLNDIRSRQCPFLTKAAGVDSKCVKPRNALGVCTITTTKPQQLDWIVCPYRALDPHGLSPIVSTIFSAPVDSSLVAPATVLGDSGFVESARHADRVYLYFSDKTGGELSIPKSTKSPELSFDVTVFECSATESALSIGRFGIFEIQTMDFHGSYQHAVNALLSAVDLHGTNFSKALSANMEWAGRSIEGPNLANVFKRTFYQMALKFELVNQVDCAGVVLGLPEAVWSSWARHLALPEIVSAGDHFELNDSVPPSSGSNAWIATLQPRAGGDSVPPLEIGRLIRVSANDLLRRAFVEVSAHISSNVIHMLRQRAITRMIQLSQGRIRIAE